MNPADLLTSRRDALISECGRYRYTLSREWRAGHGTVVFCGLNPSTANAVVDDNTVRKEVGFAKRWGYQKYVKVNAYALRSTDPKGLWKVDDPVGPLNAQAIEEWASLADFFVAAWGNHIQLAHAVALRDRLRSLYVRVHALKLTKSGNPWHPLYLPNGTQPFVWPHPHDAKETP